MARLAASWRALRGHTRPQSPRPRSFDPLPLPDPSGESRSRRRLSFRAFVETGAARLRLAIRGSRLWASSAAQLGWAARRRRRSQSNMYPPGRSNGSRNVHQPPLERPDTTSFSHRYRKAYGSKPRRVRSGRLWLHASHRRVSTAGSRQRRAILLPAPRSRPCVRHQPAASVRHHARSRRIRSERPAPPTIRHVLPRRSFCSKRCRSLDRRQGRGLRACVRRAKKIHRLRMA